MPKPIIVDVPHELGRAEAKRRLETGFSRIREQIVGQAVAFQERWDGERLHFNAGALGQKVTGRVDIFEKSIRIEVDLPWILASIAEKLQGKLQKSGMLLLEKK